MNRSIPRMAILATHPIHYQIHLTRQLADMGICEPTMLFCSRFGLAQAVDPTFQRSWQWYEESLLDNVRHVFLSSDTRPPGVSPRLVPRIIRMLRDGRYDAMLAQGYAGLTELAGMAAARRLGARVLFRGETVLNTGGGRVRSLARWVMMRTLPKLVDAFLPIGSRSAAFYRHYGVAENRLVLSPYVVDNASLLAEAERLADVRMALRSQLGLPLDRPVVLYVSKMTVRKRPGDLLRAFEGLKTAAALAFVGDGPERPELEASVRRTARQNVYFFGFQKQADLPAFYATADIFAFPSRFEPWGLVVNEAMCFGLPIVTTSGVASAADLVRPGQNGFIYPPGDIMRLHEALKCLIESRPRRQSMGAKSQEIIAGWNVDMAVQGIARTLEVRRQ